MKLQFILVVEIILLSTVLFLGQMGYAAVFDVNHKKSNMNHVEWVSHDDCFQDVKVYEDPRTYACNGTCPDLHGREVTTFTGNLQQAILVHVAMLSTLISLALGVFVKVHILYSRQNVSTPSKDQTYEKKMGPEKFCRRFSVDEINKITNTSRERNTRVIDIRLLPRTISIFAMFLCQARVICGVGGDTPLTKQNCTSKCGDVNVPYPFGFTDDGEGCYRENFDLNCSETDNPPKTYWGGYQVIDIRLESSQMRVFMALSYICYNGSDGLVWSVPLAGNIKFLSKDNVYIAIGCDTYAYLKGSGTHNYTSGCISICENEESVVEDSCSGMGCCQTSIAPGLQVYETEFRSDNNHENILDFNPCSYAFLVEKNNYTFNISDLTYMGKERSFPIVLDWSIGSQTCENAQSEPDYACVSKNSYCLNSTNGDGYICKCSSGYLGNPYLENGCQDIDECKYPGNYYCNGTCVNVPGSYNCTCPVGTIGDAKTYGCTTIPKNETSNTRVAVLVPVILISSLGSIAIGVFIYAQIQRRMLTQLRHKYFLQNGGAILEKQISGNNGTERRFKVFTMEEIEKATNKFEESRILGRGGQGIVYKGTFSGDKSTYAIKKSLTLDGSKVEEFINEMVILSQINHRNVVKLVGCCLEEENPLLVYEFVPNGTLFQHIRSRSIPWDVRLKIGVETAGALGYLHSSVSIPIIHGDVKSSNILLGDNYTAKVSDFGASRLIPVDATQVNTLVQGTLGYLDPEYLQTHELTDKSDVYSFGVVLLELLTGKTPLSSARDGEPKTLATYFLSCMEEDGSINQLLDDRIAINGGSTIIDEMTQVANIAKQCLSLRGKDRPSMMEVAMELQRLRRQESHPWHPLNVEMATQELLDPPLATSSNDIDPSMNINDEVSLLRHPKAGR